MTADKEVWLSIGLASELAGMHPQTIREYERKGLVTPARTAGGARRYRQAEIDRLRRIQGLTEQGLSLAGCAYVLGLEDRIESLNVQVSALQSRLGKYEPVKGERLPARRSISVELVHIPRRRRSPRWRNIEG